MKTKRFLISLRSIRNDIIICFLGGRKQRNAVRSAAFFLPYPPKLKCHTEPCLPQRQCRQEGEESQIMREIKTTILNKKHIKQYRIFL